jgi:hypothetical protein
MVISFFLKNRQLNLFILLNNLLSLIFLKFEIHHKFLLTFHKTKN